MSGNSLINKILVVNSPSGKELGRGKARSKKEAEQQSAKQALNHFGITRRF